MKTLCVVAAVLSLASLGHSASLACQNLTTAVQQGPDVSGSWYIIAMSSSSCLFTTLVDSLLSISGKAHFTATDTANLYNVLADIKIYGSCLNESDQTLYEGNRFYDVNENNAPTGTPDVMLHTSCTDCIVVRNDDEISLLMLLSRRQSVSEAELTEFNTQAECLGWAKPIVLNTDHDYQNCEELDPENEITSKRISTLVLSRLKVSYKEPLKCIADNLLYYPRLLISMIQSYKD